MTDTHKPHYRCDGRRIVRMGWPTVVEYEICEGSRKGEITPFMPNADTHPAPAEPLDLDNAAAARDYATGARKPRRRSLNFREIIHDLAEYERMAAVVWFRDPRHTGVSPTEFIDNLGARKNG